MLWITDIINKDNKTYSSNKEALQETIQIIARWARHNGLNVYMYNNTRNVHGSKCNRIISILTPLAKGYEYKLTIHNVGGGYKASLKRLSSSGYSYSKKEYIYISFKFYEDDPI